jgi:hypothetical protein
LHLRYQGDGAFQALKSDWADKEFVVGKVYSMEEKLDRSDLSHDHQFAWLQEAWSQLPEDLAPLYPTPTHLRKRALIVAGYCDETIIDVGSSVSANALAKYIRARDDFSYVEVTGRIITIRTAKSQRRGRGGMDKQTFQDSKNKVLEIVAAMIGVKPGELEKNAGRAA